jgi:hypothetical protein
MKFLVVFYLLFILACFVPSGKFFKMKIKISILILFIVFSTINRKSRLFNLFRRPLGNEVNSLVSTTHNDKGVVYQQLNSVEDEDHLQARNTWDSGEDYYFQWANQNRRPVEYLTGRKREVEKVVPSARDRRINGGLWRSGLVG